MRRGITLASALLALSSGAAGQGAPTASPHGTMRAAIECTACHTEERWRPLRERPTFSHDRDVGFSLEGRHARLACGRCHLALRFDEPRVAAGDCGVCHVDVHQGRLAGECADCHDSGSWQGAASVRLHDRTTFPLTGAHLRVACVACHRDDRTGAFTRLDPACESCHGSAYAATDFPDHQALGYSTECRTCHGTASWHGARFDHTTTGFPLLGVHATIACANCHPAPDRQPDPLPAGPEDCVACHRADYDHEHGGSGYPTTCTTCHQPTTWEASSFDHDGLYFPIYSGRHRGTWSTCLDCHPTPQEFAVFTCTTCHTRSETDSHHLDLTDYVYESTRCFACHPRGEADDG